MIGDDVLFAGIREQGRLMQRRALTSEELTRAYLDRLETIGPRLGAVVTVTRELALAQARQADAERKRGHVRGPLHGIPWGAKDLLATRGIPTTWGAEPYRDRVIEQDATVVTRLRDAGAVLCAKLAMVELAGGLGYDNPDASLTGPGRTPWNPAYWSGGSSSGSGAATAAGLVTFAIGSETNGSITSPATHCGISGLRPTYGLVSRHGAMALCWTLDKLGPLARSAEDCALVLAAIAGADPQDPTATAHGFVWKPPTGRPRRPLRIGVLQNATLGADPEVAANFEAAIGVLETLALVDRDVPFPDLPYGPAVGVIVDAEGASAFRDLIESGETRRLRAPADRTGGYAMLTTLAVDYLEAQRARVGMRTAIDPLLSRYDALVTPSRLSVAAPIGYDFDKAPPAHPAPPKPEPSPSPEPGAAPPPAPHAPGMGSAGNLLGVPAIAVPSGFGMFGLPTGITLMGRAHGEATLVELAHRYQQKTDWHRRRPPALA